MINALSLSDLTRFTLRSMQTDDIATATSGVNVMFDGDLRLIVAGVTEERQHGPDLRLGSIPIHDVTRLNRSRYRPFHANE